MVSATTSACLAATHVAEPSCKISLQGSPGDCAADCLAAGRSCLQCLTTAMCACTFCPESLSRDCSVMTAVAGEGCCKPGEAACLSLAAVCSVCMAALHFSWKSNKHSALGAGFWMMTTQHDQQTYTCVSSPPHSNCVRFKCWLPAF